MAESVFLTLKGQLQGLIKGGSLVKGREGEIIVIAMDHDIVSPRDPSTGLPTGRRVHKPLTITKEIDRSTPLLHNAMTNNENLTTFKLDFYHPNIQGMVKNYYRIELVNASIVEVATRLDNLTRPEFAKSAPYEMVSFIYQKITWTYLDDLTSATDDWTSTPS